MSHTGYALRDTEQAAVRLSLLSAMWEPASAPFIASCAPRGAEVAYDLGCGPGWTTRLLHETAEPARTVGLDASDAFVEKARRLHPEPEFEVYDVTRPGFPMGEADLIHCRMLLTHLAEPIEALEAWTAELRPGGVLLVDEVEEIGTDDPVFARYLEIAAGLISGRGGDLYLGPQLQREKPAGLERLHSRATLLEPDPRQVAFLFRLRLGVWRDSPDAPATRGELDEIAAGLRSRAVEGASPIVWTMRQIAYRRP